MSIVIPCPHCGCSCKIPETAAGKKVKCPRCAKPFPVPAADDAAVPVAERAGAAAPERSEQRSLGSPMAVGAALRPYTPQRLHSHRRIE